MPEPILIEFRTDVTQVEKALDALEELGLVDKQTAESFRKTAADVKKYQEEMTKTGKAVDGVKIDLKELIDEIHKIPEKIIEDGAKKSLKDTGEELDKVTGKTKKLSTQLRQMKQELSLLEQAGKQNSARYRELAIAAGKLEDQIGDTSQRVRHLASDTRGLDTALSLASGVAGGFSVAQGAAALFGSENEELQKTLLKVQAALAIVNGLQAVAATVNKDSAASVNLFNRYLGQSTGAMKAFKIAAAGLGVGLIVFAVMEGYKAWQKYSENVERAKHTIDGFGLSTETFNDIQQRTADGFIDQKVKLEGLLSVARDHTIALDDRKKALKEINEISPKYLGDLTLEKLNTDEATAAIDNYLKSLERKAKAEAAYELLVEKQKELFAAQAKPAEDFLNGIEKAGKAAVEKVNDVASLIFTGGLLKLNGVVEDIANSTAENRKAADIKGIEEDLKSLTGIYEEATKAVIINGDETEKTIDKVTKKIFDFHKAFDQLSPEDFSPIPGPNQLQTEIVDPSIKIVEDFYEKLADLQARDREQWEADMEARRQKNQETFVSMVKAAEQGFDLIGQASQNHLDTELANLQEQLDNKQISQEQYDKAVKAAKTKEAKAEKTLAIFKALIDIPAAIIAAGIITPQAIAAGLLGAAQLALIVGQKIPAFAKGTRSVEGGTPGKDSVLSLLMPGERVETAEVNRKYTPILDAIHDQRIPASFLNSIAEMPDFNALSVMLGSGMPVPVFEGIDYDLMAQAFGKQIEKLPIAELHFDEDGIYRTVRNGSNKTTYLNQRYN